MQTSEQDGVGAHHAPELGEADDAVPVPVHHLQHLLSLLTQHDSKQICKLICIHVCLVGDFVKLRQGSGKDRQGMAVKAKGLKA